MLIVTERQDRNLVFLFSTLSQFLSTISVCSQQIYCFAMAYIYQTINDDYILEFFKISNFLEE